MIFSIKLFSVSIFQVSIIQCFKHTKSLSFIGLFILIVLKFLPQVNTEYFVFFNLLQGIIHNFSKNARCQRHWLGLITVFGISVSSVSSTGLVFFTTVTAYNFRRLNLQWHGKTINKDRLL